MRYRLTFIGGFAAGYVLGARAGRERYEQLRKTARQFAQNPTVQERAKGARDAGRSVASKAASTMADKVGGRLPESVTDRVRQLRSRPADDDWGTSTT
jgi:hypothetical protein